jgi:hypothetical protein
MTGAHENSSPIARVFEKLRALNPSWSVQIGRPTSDDGWIVGHQLADATAGPLNELLLRIGSRLLTTDRRTMAALYAIRFGWASARAIAPYVKFNCPLVSQEERIARNHAWMNNHIDGSAEGRRHS